MQLHELFRHGRTLADTPPRFPEGKRLVATPAAIAHLTQHCAPTDPSALGNLPETVALALTSLLLLHLANDPGDLCTEDVQLNEDAITHGDRVFSRYTVEDQPLYVITEADRSATTVLLPEEY